MEKEKTKKRFFIARIEKATVLRKVAYNIEALSKTDALKKLDKFEYNYRDTIDTIQEEKWKPQQVIEIFEEKKL